MRPLRVLLREVYRCPPMNPTPPTMTTPLVFLSSSNSAVTAAGAFSTGRIRIHRTATVAVARTNSQRFGIDEIKNCRVMANDQVFWDKFFAPKEPPKDVLKTSRPATSPPRGMIPKKLKSPPRPKAICPFCRKNVSVKTVKGSFEGAFSAHRVGARGSSTCDGSLTKPE
jgi:hypothetical protein